MNECDDSSYITTLRSYILVVIQVVKHLPTALAGQMTRKDMVDKFLDKIQAGACGNIKDVVKDYICTYYAATIKTQKLSSKDPWNLLFSITIMKSILSDFKGLTERSITFKAPTPRVIVPNYQVAVPHPTSRST